jgi:predicted transcriptional regulator of viral defense system
MKNYTLKKHHTSIKRDDIIKDHFKNSFEENHISVFDESSLAAFLDDKKTPMKMKTYSNSRFINYLLKNDFLTTFEFSNTINKKTIYISKYFDTNSDYAKVLEISHIILPKSYISYFNALYFYNLTEQIPKKLFLSMERKSHASYNELLQENIDKALCKKGRLPSIVMEILGYEIYLVHSKDANRSGIKTIRLFDKNYRITTLERTLIDIVVRSEISGGMEEVINVYNKIAQDHKKEISINKIIFLLRKLEYIYPYHQIIAYLLNKNGFDVSKIKKEFEFKYDFYLDRGDINLDKSNLLYDDEFRVFVPGVLG